MPPLPIYHERELDSLAEEVGEERLTERVEKVCKQRIPAFVRWPIRLLMLPFVCLDLMMQRLARFIISPPYRKEGECLKRGNCCTYILMEDPKGILGKLYRLWNTEINGFYFRLDEPFQYGKKRVRLMGCRYLKKDGSCQHYWLRPEVCRKWPLIEHFGKPRILKGCGYRATKKKHPKSNDPNQQ